MDRLATVGSNLLIRKRDGLIHQGQRTSLTRDFFGGVSPQASTKSTDIHSLGGQFGSQLHVVELYSDRDAAWRTEPNRAVQTKVVTVLALGPPSGSHAVPDDGGEGVAREIESEDQQAIGAMAALVKATTSSSHANAGSRELVVQVVKKDSSSTDEERCFRLSEGARGSVGNCRLSYGTGKRASRILAKELRTLLHLEHQGRPLS
jgi:hypothetical protein